MRLLKQNKLLIFLCCVILIFCFSFFLSPLCEDEIWNYGFSYNISLGLIPYKDFNLIITPLYPMLVSIFILVFGHHLWILHLFHSILITIMIFIIYNKIGNKVFIIVPLMLYCYPSYNFFCLFLMILLFYILDNNMKKKDLVVALIISFIFLSKQTIGICLFIPMIYYSKRKVKSFITFIIPLLIFLLYLYMHDALYHFINYCFLGLFDFGTNNAVYIFLIFEIPIIIYLVVKLLKSRFLDKKIFYILMFQIITIPICDDYHFMIGFVLFLYYLLENFKMKVGNLKHYLLMSWFFFIFYNLYLGTNFYFYNNSQSYLYGRRFDKSIQNEIENVGIFIQNSKNSYDNIFLFSHSYLVKMNIGMNLNKFDLILNGNMGYDGANNYIVEIEDICAKESCLFLLDTYSVQGINYNQINYDITEYVMLNFQLNEDEDKYIIFTNKMG